MKIEGILAFATLHDLIYRVNLAFMQIAIRSETTILLHFTNVCF